MRFNRTAMLLILAAVAGCSTVKRLPPPEDYSVLAEIPGMPGARFWGDAARPLTAEELESTRRQIESDPAYDSGAPVHILALSGGGQKGAFGAGLLAGWTDSGSRPVFRMVTGVSTGALLAPFAFLGPEYDAAMKEMYSRFSTRDVLKMRVIVGLFTADSVTDNSPLRQIIMRYFTPHEMDRVAQEHARGRRLFVATTWLDVQRPVIWDIGAIASSGQPGAYRLIIDVLLASSAIPGVFPAEYFEMENHAAAYDELHVDGGVTMQVFVSPGSFSIEQAIRQLGFRGDVHVYLVLNGKNTPLIEHLEPKTVPILTQSLSTLLRAQQLGDMHRIYQKSLLNHLKFHAAFVPVDFRKEPGELFDIDYMSELYSLGYRLAEDGYPWQEQPPE